MPMTRGWAIETHHRDARKFTCKTTDATAIPKPLSGLSKRISRQAETSIILLQIQYIPEIESAFQHVQKPD
jgi:hypothetical protein